MVGEGRAGPIHWSVQLIWIEEGMREGGCIVGREVFILMDCLVPGCAISRLFVADAWSVGAWVVVEGAIVKSCRLGWIWMKLGLSWLSIACLGVLD